MDALAKQRLNAARRTSIIGALVNITLGIAKIIFGTLGHSQSLIADGIHSLSDLTTDGLVMFAAQFSHQDADHDHPYGHGRIETASTLLLSLIIILAGVGLFYDAVLHVYHGQFSVPRPLVLAVAAFSIFANELLYQYCHAVGKRINSVLVIANAWHHRSDAASSLVVLIGVAGALLGYVYLDVAAAALVGILVIRMGWQLGWSSVLELIDTGVDVETLQALRQSIADVPGVLAIHQLRTRSMAGNILVDVHIQVAPKLSVSEGHHISQQVHFKLIDQFKAIEDVTVHVDPENDEICAPNRHLLDGDNCRSLLATAWQTLPFSKVIMEYRLHYLDGKIHIEIVLPLALLSTHEPAAIYAALQQAIPDQLLAGSLTVLYQANAA